MTSFGLGGRLNGGLEVSEVLRFLILEPSGVMNRINLFLFPKNINLALITHTKLLLPKVIVFNLRILKELSELECACN